MAVETQSFPQEKPGLFGRVSFTPLSFSAFLQEITHPPHVSELFGSVHSVVTSGEVFVWSTA